MADGTAWRLVSRCTTVEEVVRGFRALASPEGFDGVAVTGVSPASGARGRVALTLASRAAVLDGEAVVTVADGKVSLRFVKLDARSRALLAHMVEHRDAEVPPPVPRHLVPLGAAPGTPGTARADAALATCAIEPLAAPSVPTMAMPSLRPPAPTGPIAMPKPAPKPETVPPPVAKPALPELKPAEPRKRPATRPPPELATTMRNAGARREPAPPTIRDNKPPAMPGPTKIGPAPAGPTGGAATASASPIAARPKREAQKTLMGMPALSPQAAEAPIVPTPPSRAEAPTEPPAPAELAAASSPALVVPSGTPPGVPTESVPVPRLRPDGTAIETGPTRPTRGPTEPSPVIVLAAQAIANSAPVQAPLDSVPTLPTPVPNIAALVPSRIDAAPSGPVDDQPTIPNDDIQTDVAFALPDLPGDDHSDPVVDPPTPAEPVPAVMVLPQEPPPPMPMPGAIPVYGSPYYQQPPPHHHAPPPQPQPYYPPPPQYPPTAQLPALQVGPGPAPGYDWRQPQNVERDDDMTEMVQLVRPPRRRWPVIAVTSAVIVIGIAVMVALTATGEDDPEAAPAPAPAPTTAPAPPPAIGTAAPAPAPPVPAPAVKTGTCDVNLTSSPDAAEVLVDGVVVGKTPLVHAGPCAGFTVTFRRERYQPQEVTVAAGATSAEARLERPSFKVKVTTRPPGATVKVGGVDAGKTPLQLELPGYETTSIELTRNGYAPHTQRVYAGKAGQKVDVKLRPRRR